MLVTSIVAMFLSAGRALYLGILGAPSKLAKTRLFGSFNKLHLRGGAQLFALQASHD